MSTSTHVLSDLGPSVSLTLPVTLDELSRTPLPTAISPYRSPSTISSRISGDHQGPAGVTGRHGRSDGVLGLACRAGIPVPSKATSLPSGSAAGAPPLRAGPMGEGSGVVAEVTAYRMATGYAYFLLGAHIGLICAIFEPRVCINCCFAGPGSLRR